MLTEAQACPLTTKLWLFGIVLGRHWLPEWPLEGPWETQWAPVAAVPCFFVYLSALPSDWQQWFARSPHHRPPENL